MHDDVHCGLQVGWGVVHASHVIEICEQADVRVACGSDECGTFADVVDEVALVGLELLDGDGNALGLGEWAETFEQGDELLVRLGLGPAVGDLPRTATAEDDELAVGLFHAAERRVRPC